LVGVAPPESQEPGSPTASTPQLPQHCDELLFAAQLEPELQQKPGNDGFCKKPHCPEVGHAPVGADVSSKLRSALVEVRSISSSNNNDIL